MIRDYVCFDLETTGINPKNDRIIEIGAVKVREGKVTDSFSELVNPETDIPEFITELTGISSDMTADCRTIDEVIPEFLEFAGNDPLLGHNVSFDYSFIKQNAVNMGIKNFERLGVDTLKISRIKLKELPSRKLDYLCKYFEIKDDNHHRALNDAQVTSKLYELLYDMYASDEPELFEGYPLNYSAKKVQPATIRQIDYLKRLMEYHNIEADTDIEKLSRSDASRKIDRILSEFGKIL